MKKNLNIKTGDTVYVLSGKDREKKAKVLSVNPSKGKVLVEGVAMITKHKKPKMNQPGGIIKQEAFVNVSNVMLVCNKCDKPTKVGKKVFEDGSKARACKKCGEVIDFVREAKS